MSGAGTGAQGAVRECFFPAQGPNAHSRDPLTPAPTPTATTKRDEELGESSGISRTSVSLAVDVLGQVRANGRTPSFYSQALEEKHVCVRPWVPGLPPATLRSFT